MGFGGLYISISGINANKKALDTVSHNIANVNNANYVRQSVIHRENSYSTGNTRFQQGTGVNIQQIRQIRDEFLDIKLRREMASFGYYSSKSEILSQVESIFNEITSSGLQNVMDEFWDGWAELYKEPDSLTIKGIVHENGVALATTIKHISGQLDDLQFELNKEMLNKTQQVNSLLARVAELNKEIKQMEAHGPHISANDYRDERNAALDRLSQLIPISHYQDQYGEEIVSLYGKDLVSRGTYSPIEIKSNEKGHGEIYWPDRDSKIDLKGLGELGGYIDARDTVVVDYKRGLDILVSTIVENINEIHNDQGQNLDFFIITDRENPSATIWVNPDLQDFEKIGLVESGAVGDGSVCKAILDMREELLFGRYDEYEYDQVGGRYMLRGDKESHLTVDGYYRDLVLSIGLERQQARSMVGNQGILIDQIEIRRQEVSSVSLDEEMTDMLKYQHSYIANSRVINAIDEMIENIVNRLGLVGR